MIHVKGYVDLVCREESGEVAWEVHQPNAVTDYGLRRLMTGFQTTVSGGTRGTQGLNLGLSPSIEAPSLYRTALPDDGGNSVIDGYYESSVMVRGTATYDPGTLTWTFGYTFGGAARTIGSIVLAGSGNLGRNANIGIVNIIACTVLNPPKIQTPSQTVEALYRVTLIPLY